MPKVLRSVLPVLAASVCASSLSAQFYTEVGPVGFVERFDDPGSVLPDETIGPPGFAWSANSFNPGLTGASAITEISPGDFAIRSVTPSGLGDEGLTILAFGYYLPFTLVTGTNDSVIVSADFLLSDLDETYLVDVRPVFFSDLAGRFRIGALCESALDCGSSATPGALHYLAGEVATFYAPMRVCLDALGAPIPGCVAPDGYTIGQALAAPVDAWFTLTHEDRDDFLTRFYVDFHDGAGPILAGQTQRFEIRTGANRVEVATAFRVEGATLSVDNIRAQGYRTTCVADANADRAIDFADLNLVLTNFGAATATGYPFGDVNNDQAVDFADLNILLARFGSNCD